MQYSYYTAYVIYTFLALLFLNYSILFLTLSFSSVSRGVDTYIARYLSVNTMIYWVRFLLGEKEALPLSAFQDNAYWQNGVA